MLLSYSLPLSSLSQCHFLWFCSTHF